MQIEIYKLKYTDKSEAISDLIAKNVIDEECKNLEGTHAVVDIGLIQIEQGVYDDEGVELTAPLFAEGYHFDVMSENIIDFGDKRIEVNNPKHTFAGHEII